MRSAGAGSSVRLVSMVSLICAAALGALAPAGCRRSPPGTAPAPAPAAPPAPAGSGPGAPAAAAPDAVPAGTLLASDGFAYFLAVYAPARLKKDPRAIVSRLLPAGPLVLGPTGAAPPPASEDPLVFVLRPPLSEAPLPDEAAMRGLTADEQRGLGRLRDVTVLAFRGPPTQALMAYTQALAMAGALAEAARGFVYDAATGELYSRAAWTKRIEAQGDNFPDLASHVTIRAEPNEARQIRMSTAGMSKFALPDLAVSGVAPPDEARMGALLALAAQTLTEGARLPAAGKLPVSVGDIKQSVFRERAQGNLRGAAKGTATLDLARGARAEGDPDNRLVEIVFPGPAAEAWPRRITLFLDGLYGAEGRTGDPARSN